MKCHFTVFNSKRDAFYSEEINEKEYQKIDGYIKESKSTVSLISATLKPVRTNYLSDFLKDFFLPTTINHAVKVQNVVSKFFAILGSLVLDAVTLPIRLLTCIPRIISNEKRENTAFHKYLSDQKFNYRFLESGHVYVRLEKCVTTKSPASTSQGKGGIVEEKYTQKSLVVEKAVNFIEQPAYEGSGKVIEEDDIQFDLTIDNLNEISSLLEQDRLEVGIPK